MAEAVLARTTTISDHTWTVRDVERMALSLRYELVEGVLYVSALPFWPHPDIVSNLVHVVGGWVRGHRRGRAYTPQTGIYLSETNYLDPDVVYLRPDQVPRVGERCTTATMAGEVLSPSNVRASREERERLYARAGVGELWYIDYPARTLEVRHMGADGYETTALFGGDDTVETPAFPGLSFPLPLLWEDIRE